MCLTNVAVLDGEKSEKMSNRPLMTDRLGGSYEQCLGACTHLYGRAVGCHAICVKNVPSASRASIIDVMIHQYEPSRSEIARRINKLSSAFATTISHYATPNLPLEVCLMISRYFLEGLNKDRHAAICLWILRCLPQGIGTHPQGYMNLKSWPNGGGSDNSRICVSTSIWARFVDFEGIQYVSSLSNSYDEYHTHHVFAPDPTQLVDSVYVSENYLGVMQVVFCSSVQPPAVEPRQDLWWRVLRLNGCDAVLVTQTDVSA